jgi:PAS domain S-box-containing protein
VSNSFVDTVYEGSNVILRPGTTLASDLSRPGDLIDAAIAVNEAPTLREAFQVMADAGLALLGCDRLGVTLWNGSPARGTRVAAAGLGPADIGAECIANDRVLQALETGEPYNGPPPRGVAPGAAGAAVESLSTVVGVPLVTESSRAIFHAGWLAELDADELTDATNLLRTLTRLTSLAERSLREREQARLDNVLENTLDGVIVTAGTSVTPNAAARAILGIPEGTELRSAMFVPRTLEGEPYPLAADLLPGGKATESGTGGRFRIRATSLDGRELVLDGSVAPVPRGAVIVFRDVTAEHARAVLNERSLYELFNSLPIPLSIVSPDTRESLSVNQAFLDLIGFTRDEVVGRRPPYPWWDPTEDAGARDRLPLESVVHRVFRRKDGRPLPVEVATHAIPGDDGEVALVLGVVADLSEKRRLDQQLVQSGKLAAIGELAAGVAHEINNPLFAILGLTEFLLKESEPGSKAEQRLELIQQTGLEIKEIVRALLDFARENAEERHVVALEDVVHSTVDLVRRTNAHKGVELVDSYDRSGGTVHGSPNQLKQIFLNLIANARQAMPNGGTVHVDVHREGDRMVASVSDDGPGIEPKVLERIFEPFFTTKRVTGGTGLGLSVSLGIAEAHGGSLVASSEPGRGATFTLCLPVVEEGE